MIELLKMAQAQVNQSVLFKRFIEHTPLENDIAVWMATFAHERIATLEAELAKEKESLSKCPQCSFTGRDDRGWCKECAEALYSLGKGLQEEEADNARLEAEVATLRAFCGNEPFRSDYQTASDMRKHLEMLKADNSSLRACLKRLEWAEIAYGFGGATAKRCPACRAIGESLYEGHGHYRQPEGHAPDCWLAAEIEREGLERE